MELDGLLEDFPIGKRMDSTSDNKLKVSTENILDDMSRIESSTYSSVVSIPAYYAIERRLTKRKLANISRKVAGIPFAMLYGVFLYFLLRYVILTEPRDYGRHDNDMETNTNYGHINNTPIVYFYGTHRPEHVYISSAFTVTIGAASIFSRGTRCSLLLMLPCVITGRSRTILFTFIMGLLAEGPINNLVHNFNEISKNTVCMYKAFSNLTKNSLMKLNLAVIRSKNIFNEGNVHVSKRIYHPNFTFPQISAINAQISTMQNGISDLKKYVVILRKAFTILSILLLTIDAMLYLRCYYSDNSFDNLYICQGVRKIWKERGYEELTPLRRWEINEGYNMYSSAKFTKRELTKSFQKLTPTMVFTLFSVLVMVSDSILVNIIHSTKGEENIRISFKGMEKEVKHLVTWLLSKFNESTGTCVTRVLMTSANINILISFLLILPAISCLFEVYMSRIRARLCNVFYTDRAQERADYLYYRINAGRINRRVLLKLTVRRALERQERLKEFSPWSKLKALCCCCKQSNETAICPGCGWKIKVSEAEDVYFTLGETTMYKICNDCNLDT